MKLSSSSVRARVWTLPLCLAPIGAVVFSTSSGWKVRAAAYLGMTVVAVAGLSAGIVLHRPTPSRPWRLLAAGAALFLLANAIWYGYPNIKGALPFPSIADALFVGSYLVQLAGLLLFVSARGRRARRSGALTDAAIVAVSIGTLYWRVLIEPYAAAGSLSVLARVTAIAYPVLDLALAAVLARLMLSGGRRRCSYVLLLCAVLLQLGADAGYGILVLDNGFHQGHPIFLLWILSYGALGAAGLHPSMREVCAQTPEAADPSRRRLLMLSAASLMPPALLLLPHGHHTAAVTAVATVGLFLLIFHRMAGFLREAQDRAVSLRQRDEQLSGMIDDLNVARDSLAHQARHDPLTGLANRTLLRARMDEITTRSREPVAMLLLDLDDFKTVNDSLGHESGDALLQMFAARLQECVRRQDTAARLGGDEFAVLLPGADIKAAYRIANRIFESLHAPIQLQSREIFVRASIGIALGLPGADGAEILRNADSAMYAAKAAGGMRAEVFEAAFHVEYLRRLALESELTRAVEREEFELHYQPIVELRTSTITGFEALVRWHHPERGLVPPNDFIPIAEETGLIVPLGRWVLGTACRQLAAWQETPHGRALKMSVNVSTRQLMEPSIIDEVASVIAETGIDPASLTLEVTETLLMRDMERGIRRIDALKELGVKVAVDDFGTGYSSLAYVRRFSSDALKIDRSFIRGITEGPEESAVARATIRLAHFLGLRVVAEGVETAEQADQLRTLGCDDAQGYLFSKPLPAAEAEALVTHATTLRPPAATSRQTVLIVDDDDQVCRSLQRLLTRAGYRVVTAANGADALQALYEDGPDMLILDVQLPDTTGPALAARMRAVGQKPIPILMMSGEAVASRHRIEGLDAGADAYLLKPVAAGEVIATVRALLRARAEERADVPA